MTNKHTTLDVYMGLSVCMCDSRQLSGPQLEVLLEVGDVVRLDASDDHSGEALLALLFSNQAFQKQFLLLHNMGTVTWLKGEPTHTENLHCSSLFFHCSMYIALHSPLFCNLFV